jgi:uncharacterized cupredoxin-like copper-binding protein
VNKLVLLVSVGVMLLLLCTACGRKASADMTIGIQFSRFVPGETSVPAGVPVTITLRNDDPIEHEWIIGTEQVHEVHRNGTEAFHDTRPTEVTIPALSAITTTVTFERAGELLYICHLPGHEAYGMVGMLTVTGD